jgi:hypothetical protein
MDEDLFYHHQIVTATSRRPSQPPPYIQAAQPRRPSTSAGLGRSAVEEGSEMLPDYSCSINCEGVFAKKMEIENTIKRAEDRRWHSAFVVLTGTALDIYEVKKEWGWGRGRDGPDVSPDNPPWLKKGKLEKRYSLQYADVGIALDYQKYAYPNVTQPLSSSANNRSRRRHVIRVRAEADQFLFSCIELGTFLKWLELLFAAIDVAAPIDERDFPRDQSIPRIQRLRWYRGQSPARRLSILSSPRSPDDADPSIEGGPSRRPSTTPSEFPSPSRRQTLEGVINEVDDNAGEGGGEADGEEDDYNDGENGEPESIRRDRERELFARISTTSYPHEAIDYLTGKWTPTHHWSEAHDMLYAKLCYSALLFRSPRKSNYIINKGKKWFVDWATGRMVRVLPPEYGEIYDWLGPWQTIHTENRRI